MLTINVCLHTATAVTSHRAVLDQQPAERLCSSTRRWSLPWGIANLDSVLIDLIVTFIILLRDSCSFVTVMMTRCHALVCEAQVLACCCAVEKISAQAAEQPRPVLRSTSGVGMLQAEAQGIRSGLTGIWCFYSSTWDGRVLHMLLLIPTKDWKYFYKF